jgi:diguanylate cyclase (GGDEF)-like protein
VNNPDNTQYSSYNYIPCGIVIFNPEPPFKIIYANDIYRNDFAQDKEELNIYEEDFELFHTKLKQRTKNFTEGATIDYRIETPNSHLRWLRMIVSKPSTPGSITAVLSDVTSQHNMFNMLERERTRYAIAMSCTHDVIFEHDVAADICSLFIPSSDGGDPKTHEIENFSDKLKHQTIIHPDDISTLFDENFSINNGVQIRLKFPQSTEWLWYQIHCTSIYDEFGHKSKIIGAFHNIESIKKNEEQLKNKIEIDLLSKVYTRAAAIEKINLQLSKKSNTEQALFIIDLDDFKSINDTYGHLYGDAIISMVAGCIKSGFNSDDIIGRFGGDEFFALANIDSIDNINTISDKIIKSVFNLCKTTEHQNTLSCSIGAALRSDFPDNATFDILFEAADKALYQAKNSGKNRFILYDKENCDNQAYETAYSYQRNSEAISSVSGNITTMAIEIITKSKSTDNAIATLLQHIGIQFDLDFIQIMNIDCTTDMVTIDHEWSKDSNVVNISNRMGYYIHSDIEKLINLFKENNFFILHPDIINKFSPKLSSEFNKLDGKKVIYSAAINNEHSFNMIIYQCFDNNRNWSSEEMESLSEVTKLLSVYIGNPHAPTAREKYLQSILDHDPLTGVYTRKKLYELSGLVRKKALETNDTVFIAHCDFADFSGFNIEYGYSAGNEIIIHFANALTEAFPQKEVIIARADESDKYILLTHAPNSDNFFSTLEKTCNDFTQKFNQRFKNHPLITKTGITELRKNEWLVASYDRIKRQKKTLGKITENKIFYI